MKKTSKLLPLLLQVTALGLLGCALRLVLYRVGFDEKGILPSSHPLHIGCCVLVMGSAIWILLRLRSMKKRDLRTGSLAKPLRLLSAVGGGLLLLNTLSLFPARGMLPILRGLLNAGSGAAMLFAVSVPKRRHDRRAICFGLICSTFAVDMVCRYQSWSGNPQLPDYVFQVFACICLNLCAYQRLALEVGMGKAKHHVFFSLTALLLCLMSAAGPDSRVFYLACAVWAGAGISTPKALPAAKPEPAPQKTTPEKEEP